MEVANVAALCVGVNAGLGQRSEQLGEDSIARSRRALIASFTLTFLVEGLSSISFVCLLRSMNPDKNYGRALTAMCCVIAAWSVAGIVRFAVASIQSIPQPLVRSSSPQTHKCTD